MRPDTTKRTRRWFQRGVFFSWVSKRRDALPVANPPYYRVGVYVCQPWQHDYFSVIYQAIGRSVGHLSSGVVVVDPFFFFEKRRRRKDGASGRARARGRRNRPVSDDASCMC
jgi:hypothetical protein